MKCKTIFIALLQYIFILQCTAQINPYNYHSQKKVTVQKGAVVSAHPLASKAGVKRNAKASAKKEKAVSGEDGR